MDRPLAEDDFYHIENIQLDGSEDEPQHYLITKKRVAEAKRLLKQKLEALPYIDDNLSEIEDLIDSCFQIEDKDE